VEQLTPIPDEAHQLTIEETNREEGPWMLCSCGWSTRLGFTPSPAEVVTEAVAHDPTTAPHIARAAAVVELRAMAAQLRRAEEKWGGEYTAGLNAAVEQVQERADCLEADDV